MLERDVIIEKHNGCPNRHHCCKNEEHCCYLHKGDNTCYLDSEKARDYL
jgi:hypothetical protein